MAGKKGCNRKHLIKPVIDRFNKKYTINKSNWCWEWHGCISKSGYGSLKVGIKARRAHRVSYELFIGEIPIDKEICHTCDNKKCVSPFHIYAGTHAENMEDARESNLMPTAKCPSRRMYTNGCRCEGCVKANRDYYRNWSVSNKEKINLYYNNRKALNK